MVTTVVRSVSLQKTIQISLLFLLAGCASSIDATRDVQIAHTLAAEHLPVDVDPSLMWNASEPLTIDAAIAYAVSHDAILQRDLTLVVQRRAEIAQAELPANPTITGAFGIAVDGLAGAPLILQGVQNLSWLWTRPDRIASAEQTLRQAILTSANRTIEVVANVRIAHHEVATNIALTRLTKEDVELTTQLLNITKEHAQVGEASSQDVDNAKIALLQSQHNLVEAQEKFDIAMLNLLHTMGCPETETVFTIVSTKPGVLEEQVEEDLFVYAIDNRLDLATSRAMIAQRSAELGLANPPLITGSVMFNENFNDRQAILPGGGITIALDGDAKEAAADAKLKQAELQYVDEMRTVIKDVRVLYETYTAAVEKLNVDEQVLKTALQSLARSQDASSKGELHPLSLLPIVRSVVQAKQHVLNDQLQVTTNAIKLEQAVGGSIKGMNQ